ncbi:MAG: FeoB-associated Cys-rich membrane protein [Deltaproteobacteria bacterium]|nr:FeoB-associated Cys-rich membrane protein [Deltaproteobacteria bacterium]MBW2017446.1 FeoB-associated Cys-rich membrane protein [Deltaproteobacteria bacterium]MBW2129598.1 FeoB-associated Cys-rich membrane protein [Deltaproteobacteria bacterium]MBW2304278.1 FeoB-associated Cys-rich membrane protein [Deltaproteobacteria bacterium]
MDDVIVYLIIFLAAGLLALNYFRRSKNKDDCGCGCSTCDSVKDCREKPQA